MKNNKKKLITIRITENQYKRLIDTVIEEEINKSQFIRESIKYQISKIKRKNRTNLS
jgi:hypothetical protein